MDERPEDALYEEISREYALGRMSKRRLRDVRTSRVLNTTKPH